MKNALFATVATAVLLTASSAFATPLAAHDYDGPRYEQRPGDRDFNYGYPKNYRVSAKERARWEAAHRNDSRDNDRRDDRRDNDRFDRNQNFGFDRDHQVTRDERRRWEEGHNYGYDQNHRVTPQERARWEAQYRR